MSVLVLGGAGYIGSHTVYELIEQGEDVIVVDNLMTGHRQAVHPEARFYKGDIRNRDFMKWVLRSEKPEAVIDFAACSLTGESMQHPLKYYDNNLFGTKTLLEAMVECGVSKIVFSSSAAVYGEPDRVPIREEDSTKPENTFGETQLAMERMFHWVSRAHGIHYVSLRYFNACGAHASGKIGEAHNEETHLIPLLLQCANGTRSGITIYGDNYNTKDGTCIRDYVHVTDLARAHILALDYLRKHEQNNIFNLGTETGFSVKEVIDMAEEITGKSIDVTVSERRLGDPAILVASAEKAKKILKWKLEYSNLETIISSAWRWHSTYPNGYIKLKKLFEGK